MAGWVTLVVLAVVLVAYLVWAERADRWSRAADDALLAERMTEHLSRALGVPASEITVEVHRGPLCWHPHHMVGRAWARARRRFLAWVERVDARSRGG